MVICILGGQFDDKEMSKKLKGVYFVLFDVEIYQMINYGLYYGIDIFVIVYYWLLFGSYGYSLIDVNIILL